MWAIQQKNPTLKSLVVLFIILLNASGSFSLFNWGKSSATKALKETTATKNSVSFHLELAHSIESSVPVPDGGLIEGTTEAKIIRAHQYSNTVIRFMNRCGHYVYVPDDTLTAKAVLDCIQSGWEAFWDQIHLEYAGLYAAAYENEEG